MIPGIKYHFTARPWLHTGPSSWHFIALPDKLSKEIRSALKSEERGWGRLKAVAKVGNSEWETSIWFDTKQNTYLLPLKAEVRRKENIQVNKTVEVWVCI